MRFCVATHFNKLGFAISKTKLLKFLYKATTEIPQNNSLRNSIPFYWYIDGPFSPPLLTLKEQLLQDNILQSKGIGYIASNQRLCDHDESFQEIRQLLTKIITAPTSRTSTAVIDDLYEHEAPYKFYISFKSRFTGMLANYLHDNSSRFIHTHLEDILHRTVGELPNKSLFSQFKYAYLDFINILLKVTKLELSEVSKVDVEKITWSIFETFAKGVRILHHDSYFEPQVQGWKIQFENSINNMEQSIDKLHELSKNLGLTDSNLLSFSTLIDHILNLKSKDKLVMVSFLPPKNDVALNYGNIDAELFKTMDDAEFQSLLKKFADSHNAIIHYAGKKDLESTSYRLLTS